MANTSKPAGFATEPLCIQQGLRAQGPDNWLLMNQPLPHAELIATFLRAEADAAHKLGLIKSVAKKGPKAIQAAVETAAKAAKRRDSYAKKLTALAVHIKD